MLAAYPGVVQAVGEKQNVLVAQVDAPSLGYRVYSSTELLRASQKAMGKNAAESEGNARVSVSLDGNMVTLDNDLVGAVISKANSWAIVSLVDKKAPGGPRSVLQKGNLLQWRFDGGNIYRYGFEEGCGFDLYNTNIVPSAPILVEKGPIRTVVRVMISMSATTPRILNPQNYTIEYTLVKGEPYLRINVTGSAAGTSAVMTSFQFNNQINNYTHGTTYHWDWKQPCLRKATRLLDDDGGDA